MMPYIRGYEEDGFVKQLEVTRQSLEIISPEKVIFQVLITMEVQLYFYRYLFGIPKQVKLYSSHSKGSPSLNI